MGIGTAIAGKYAFDALEKATEDLKAGKIDALVTLPINKHSIQEAGFAFPGHTEYLQSKAEQKDSLMLMVSQELKIGVATGHIPLKDVSSHLHIEKLHHKITLLANSLKSDFGIRKPKIAVLGLNPHAGDNGALGKEEETVIIPAIQKANNHHLTVFGPYPADGFFGKHSYREFDAVLAMYHDQGLIPFKSLSFDNGTNFTAGLPFVRTSPAHGTGYDIAGKNLADESSFREALYLAIDIVRNRKIQGEISENPLKIHRLTKDKGE
jgi:4-hydroxythreonine-4-phosphate dehydrogenase